MHLNAWALRPGSRPARAHVGPATLRMGGRAHGMGRAHWPHLVGRPVGVGRVGRVGRLVHRHGMADLALSPRVPLRLRTEVTVTATASDPKIERQRERTKVRYA